MSSDLAIEASGLVKTFGDTHAVDGVDLAVRRGAVYGVLGPNGAGETTTIRMLATLLRPDAGSARVCGHDVVAESDDVRAAVSLTGQLASVDEDLSGRENLILIARQLGLGRPEAKQRADELLDAFGLREAAGKLVKNFSGGMRRRLDIAASIVVTPELLFLDEPTTGLDPCSRNQVWDIIRALAGQGTTILLCTQYLDEADQLAERIAVIDRGKVIAEGTPSELKASVGSGTLHVRLVDSAQRPEAERLLAVEFGDSVWLESDPAALSVGCPDAERAAEAVAALARAGIAVGEFSRGQPSLDEVFLALTGHTAEEAEDEDDDEQDPDLRLARHAEGQARARAVMSVLFTTVYSGVALNTDMTKGVVDRFRSLPIWRPAPLVVVFSFGLSWVFTTMGLLMRSPNAVMNTGFMVLFPLTFLSNTFVQPDTLPSALEAFVDANPISNLVSASRGLMAGSADGSDIAIVLIVAAALTAVFAPLTAHLYRTRG